MTLGSNAVGCSGQKWQRGESCRLPNSRQNGGQKQTEVLQRWSDCHQRDAHTAVLEP